jgi:lactoylglutathione lyase
MIAGIATVAVYVEDQDRSLAFWTQQVGFTVHLTRPMGPAGSWIEVGPRDRASCLVLYPKSMMPDWAERKPSIVFSCDNIERTYREMADRGVRFSQPPKDMAWGLFAMFEDVDGNGFGLRQESEASAEATPSQPAR